MSLYRYQSYIFSSDQMSNPFKPMSGQCLHHFLAHGGASPSGNDPILSLFIRHISPDQSMLRTHITRSHPYTERQHTCRHIPEKIMESTSNSHSGVVRKSAEDCAICLDKIQEKKTLKCRHSFCSECIDSVFKLKPACPICNTYHGEYTGTQPPGTMAVTRSWQRLPGFERCGSIVIQYSFPSGIQGTEHPNPGVRYSGTTRTAFLPDCKEGEKVLKLLRKAFDRRLIFTIGRSVTTGLNNVITWNDIHHKTNIEGGPQCFGYPDPEYLFRVQEELRLKGVTEDP